ncbi:bifunctional glutamate N-acetyltransferase/amino-acid acetyltransferase ArgJ [Limibaculum sp. M0105]|uniref:Arginine biosynthesis bifunctional protein ArgJ n=1 Tax=Thermohalobaculum xanthum TaxID=2753746 RepID=A0A8J7M6H4_9RHOB|nr:bifunctional glutamate N-acetyltransferase/amino-acid acetyltransferase ArgJ [Thermohalobaculum xanthum]MBK0398610.1 bifunctional glutamate N-acetyltransferase/amino-acid acetyltransferase ArgJ [Thermohalobaculum xanthum]
MTTGDDAAARLDAKRRELEALTAEIAALEAATGKKKPAPVSPLAPASFPDLPAIAGVRLAAGQAGVRYKGRLDVMLAELAPGSVMAGTFTRSSTRSAPVLWCEERIAALSAAAEGPLGIVVNSGNSNAFTGRNGREAVERVMEAAGKALGTAPGNCFMASTGVIGEPLPHERITAKLDELVAALSPDAMEPAARAIMTTDTFPKGAVARADIDGARVTISGFAKGSGMIAPDMGTMLVFIFTDCSIAQPLLQALVRELTDRSFNAITVDGDTSTSDTLLVGATGKAAMAPITDKTDPRLPAFAAALEDVMRDLAIQVVKDGEGATKLVRITVAGAESVAAARRIGLAIANSPLVKTAVAGEDPNWGRIVMAVGKSGEKADRDRLSIRFGDILVAEKGWVSPAYREADGAAYMKRQEIDVHVDVGVGTAEASVWTCDLTKRYIEINADYRS